jgi:hypothetical protein
MRKHRNPRGRVQQKRPIPDNRSRLKLPAPPPEPQTDEVDSLLYVLLDQLRRTDAFTTTAENELVESWSLGDPSDEEDEDGGVQRRRMRVEYLVEAAKLEVRAAQYTGDQLVAEWAKRRRGA